MALSELDEQKIREVLDHLEEMPFKIQHDFVMLVVRLKPAAITCGTLARWAKDNTRAIVEDIKRRDAEREAKRAP